MSACKLSCFCCISAFEILVFLDLVMPRTALIFKLLYCFILQNDGPVIEDEEDEDEEEDDDDKDEEDEAEGESS